MPTHHVVFELTLQCKIPLSIHPFAFSRFFALFPFTLDFRFVCERFHSHSMLLPFLPLSLVRRSIRPRAHAFALLLVLFEHSLMSLPVTVHIHSEPFNVIIFPL